MSELPLFSSLVVFQHGSKETRSLSGQSVIRFKRQLSSTVCAHSTMNSYHADLRNFLTALNSKERVCYDDASLDSRFSSEAGQTAHRSVICLPIFSNRGQTFGAVYFASKYPFPQNTVTILTLLCQQASISISNALLFRSVQAGTRENLKMIAAQKEALEAARRSREDALKATKVGEAFISSV
jgi:GAF domain-containing protein